MSHDSDSAQIATLIEQGKWVIKEIEMMRSEIKELVAFKMKLIGVGIFCGAVGTMAFDFLKGMMR